MKQPCYLWVLSSSPSIYFTQLVLHFTDSCEPKLSSTCWVCSPDYCCDRPAMNMKFLIIFSCYNTIITSMYICIRAERTRLDTSRHAFVFLAIQ